jgi:hypothetical protein
MVPKPNDSNHVFVIDVISSMPLFLIRRPVASRGTPIRSTCCGSPCPSSTISNQGMALPTHAEYSDKHDNVDETLGISLPELQDCGMRTLILGVHRVIYVPPPAFRFRVPANGIVDSWRNLRDALPSVEWLFRQLFTLCPWACTANLGLDMLLGLQPIFNAYLTNHMMSLVSYIYLLLNCANDLNMSITRLKWDIRPATWNRVKSC